jgi:hypothetical protein
LRDLDLANLEKPEENKGFNKDKKFSNKDEVIPNFKNFNCFNFKSKVLNFIDKNAFECLTPNNEEHDEHEYGEKDREVRCFGCGFDEQSSIACKCSSTHFKNTKKSASKEDNDLDIMALGTMEEWSMLEKGITVDSGAAECVMPLACAPHVPITESVGSRNGLHYVAAGGARIPNVGQKRVKFATHDGQVSAMTFQVADINKPLASVSKICKKGHRDHKVSGKKTYLKEKNGVYVLDAWIMPKDKEPVFARQG